MGLKEQHLSTEVRAMLQRMVDANQVLLWREIGTGNTKSYEARLANKLPRWNELRRVEPETDIAPLVAYEAICNHMLMPLAQYEYMRRCGWRDVVREDIGKEWDVYVFVQ